MFVSAIDIRSCPSVPDRIPDQLSAVSVVDLNVDEPMQPRRSHALEPGAGFYFSIPWSDP